MPLKPIEPRRLYQQVAAQLRGLIESGEYAVGERLPTERELSEQLGISRPTVREALIALEVEGRIRIRVGSGIYVIAHEPAPALPEGLEGPFELLSAREVVESAIAGEAAGLARPADIERLDTILGGMEHACSPSPETISLDREFHVALAEILGNAVLTRLVGELFDRRMTPYFERLSTYFENDRSWRLALAEHRAVRDAVAGGDGAAAAAAMRSHLRNSQARFQHSFGEEEPPRKARRRIDRKTMDTA